MKLTTTCLLVLCWLVPAYARADVFLFNAAFSTTGTFGCRSFLTCSGGGTNTLTVQSTSGSATLTFTGVDTTVPLTTRVTPASLGTITLSTTPGFVFPAHPANPPELPVIFFALAISQATPVAATNAMHWAFAGGRSDLTVKIGGSYSTLPSGSAAYPEIIYTVTPFPVRIVPNASTDITANIGAVPEPASLVLLGTGLIAATVARRKRRPQR